MPFSATAIHSAKSNSHSPNPIHVIPCRCPELTLRSTCNICHGMKSLQEPSKRFDGLVASCRRTVHPSLVAVPRMSTPYSRIGAMMSCVLGLHFGIERLRRQLGEAFINLARISELIVGVVAPHSGHGHILRLADLNIAWSASLMLKPKKYRVLPGEPSWRLASQLPH